jgi:phosphatidylglycerol:prolipoprotein diacylglycerol transferase
MHPELFEIPFVHLTVKSYGLMMVIGFLVAVFVIRSLSRDIASSPQMITNAALYSLIAGVLGARLFYVVHHWSEFQGDWHHIFAIWHGGLELLGGVTFTLALIIAYLFYHKLPVRRYLDILAIGLMLALAFGRIGCHLNGCCFGKPTQLPLAVRFPYYSPSYLSQVFPDPARNRSEPWLKLPSKFFGYVNSEGRWIEAQSGKLKPYRLLSDEEKHEVTEGIYRALKVHPTQLYSSANAALLSLILCLFWRWGINAEKRAAVRKVAPTPGCTFSLMFILYGTTRFLLEFLRDDNPFEVDSLTISQIICLGLAVLGLILISIFLWVGPDKISLSRSGKPAAKGGKKTTGD